MKSIIFATFLVALAGCASDPAKEYAKQYQGAVLSGQMKWSTYYQGMYDSATTSKRTDSRELSIYSNLISSAQQYEHGQISLGEFQNAQRIAEIQKRQLREQVGAQWANTASGAMGAAAESNRQDSIIAQQRADNVRALQPQVQPININIQPQPNLMRCFGCH